MNCTVPILSLWTLKNVYVPSERSLCCLLTGWAMLLQYARNLIAGKSPGKRARRTLCDFYDLQSFHALHHLPADCGAKPLRAFPT
jgi:hypothetical protein